MDREIVAELERVCPGAAARAAGLGGQAVVVKSGGLIVGDAEHGAALLDDLAMLRRAGLRPIVVHGGAAQADARLKALGIEPKRIGGMRVTDARTLSALLEVFGGLNDAIVRGLNARGVRAEGFSGPSNRLVRAARLEKFGGELQFVGRVVSVDAALLAEILETAIPVVGPLAPDGSGRVYNVNADYMAAHLAIRGGVKRMVLLSDVPGVLERPGDPSSRIPVLSREEAKRLIASGAVGGGMAPKIDSMFDCLDNGVESLHIIDGKAPNALLRQMFGEGDEGTRIAP